PRVGQIAKAVHKQSHQAPPQRKTPSESRSPLQRNPKCDSPAGSRHMRRRWCSAAEGEGYSAGVCLSRRRRNWQSRGDRLGSEPRPDPRLGRMDPPDPGAMSETGAETGNPPAQEATRAVPLARGLSTKLIAL